MKRTVFTIVTALFLVFALCSCSGGDIAASVNGINIEKSSLDEFQKSNEIMKELMTEQINSAQLSEDERAGQLEQINNNLTTDKEKLLDILIENAYINSRYSFISHEQAKEEMTKQLQNIDSYSSDYPDVAVSKGVIDEYIKRLGITEDEYIDKAADSYVTLVNKQKAKDEYGAEKQISGEELDSEFEKYIKAEIDKTLVIY